MTAPLNHDRSNELMERTRRILPGGVNSPVRAYGAVGGEPVVLASGAGATVTDVDGNEYIDYVGSWGPLILGHAHPKVLRAIRAALARGGAVVAADMDEAIMLANEFAPEHLCLLTEDAEVLAKRITNAGGLFIGEHSPEVLGDYTAGPSHVMPTGGTARFASPLTVLDFLKVTSTVSCSQEDLVRLGGYTIELARAEGLTGHARSIERRLEGR